jgi:FkbH-like protein
MQELLTTVNLLPSNVVYVDDNPVERQNMKLAFPEMRVLGANPYLTRRALLWSPETQLATLSQEALRRTDMVTKQIERESLKRNVSREDFLKSLKVRLSSMRLASPADRQFQRCFELLNKTNQFNTTGKRWTEPEATASFEEGYVWYCFSCVDNFTDYGIISVAIVQGQRIEQIVLSCRVFGFEVENAILSVLVRLAGLSPSVNVVFAETEKNHVALQILRDIGFVHNGPLLTFESAALNVPKHISWGA